MILVNGVAAESIAATDRGLAYGDGVFRTLLLKKGRPSNWQRHFGKLAQDCAALNLDCPAETVLAGEVTQLARQSPDAVVKIIITRGSGVRGYALPQSPSPTRVVISAELPNYPQEYSLSGVKVHVCSTQLSFQPRLAGIKHLNRLENVLARAEWNDPTVAEGILLDVEGSVVGGTMTNLFVVESGGLVTPALTRCGVAGVTREKIVAAAQKSGMICREENIALARLLEAQEAMLVNSVIGVWQIAACAGRSWAPGAVTRRVREWLDDERI
jgi:4-amino-4-deoxychorismate lyase